MAKSDFQKAFEKQARETQKAAREEEIRTTAQTIVNGARTVNGFRIMDKESEDFLTEILNQYDGNENNCVNFDTNMLPNHLQEAISVNLAKLKMYGMITNSLQWLSGAEITLSETGKTYFKNKEDVFRHQGDYETLSRKSKEFDVFISHANKDKLTYVDDLYRELLKLGIKIWYDTEEIGWGDSLKEEILKGTEKSEFAIIVISDQFFGRDWTEKELDEFLKRQNESGQKIILPILYNVSLEEFKEHYPELSDIKVLFADEKTLDEIVILFAKELIKRLRN